MPQPHIDVTGVTSYVDADGDGTVANPYVPKISLTQTNAININNISGNVSLPTGAATSANQSTTNATLSTINTKLPSNLTVTATRLLVDGSGVTQPISATSLPLPTNAATAAKQPALGTAGTASTDVITVQGISGGVALPVSITTAPSGLAYSSAATITRAANITAYTANDVYGSVFQIQNIASSGGVVFLSSIEIIFNLTALPSGMGAFAIYLYSSSPPSAITDNLPFSLSSDDRASSLTPGGITLTASLARGGGSVVAEALNLNRLIKLANGSTSIWGYLVTLAAFTPVANSETATITVEAFAP